MIANSLTALLLMLLIQGVRAGCVLPAASANLGALSSFSISNSAESTTSSIAVNCGSGSLLSLLSSNYISLQLTGASTTAGNRAALTSVTGDSIPLQLCTSDSCNTELTINGTTLTYGSGQLVNVVGILGGLNFSLPLWIRTVPGQSVAAGNYSVTLNVLTRYAICTGISALGLCLAGSSQSGAAIEPITVNLTVTNDCASISAPAINFGSAPLAGSFSPVYQNIRVVCTRGSTYSVGISNGNHAINGVRNMASGNHLLSYDIFKASDHLRWGDSGSARWPSPLSSSLSGDGMTRSYHFEAAILPSQSTPPAGNYRDNLVIDLSF